MTSRPSTAAPILAVLAIGLALLGAYVGGYYWLGECRESGNSFSSPSIPCRNRTYPYPWQSNVFAPVGWLEARLIGKPVKLYDQETIKEALSRYSSGHRGADSSEVPREGIGP